MYLRRVSELANYLSDTYRPADEIAKFIILRTLSQFAPTALYMAEITTDGYLAPAGSFGFEKRQLDRWERFPLTLNIPITDSVRNDICFKIASPKEFLDRYPETKTFAEGDEDWKSFVAWPMLPYGVGCFLFQAAIPADEEFEFFLRSIGAVIALNQLQGLHALNHSKGIDGKNTKAKKTDLTDRQIIVRDLLLKGFTNLEISREIGYSESLVRHETIEIYRVMGVTGRKQLIAEAASVS